MSFVREIIKDDNNEPCVFYGRIEECVDFMLGNNDGEHYMNHVNPVRLFEFLFKWFNGKVGKEWQLYYSFSPLGRGEVNEDYPYLYSVCKTHVDDVYEKDES